MKIHSKKNCTRDIGLLAGLFLIAISCSLHALEGTAYFNFPEVKHYEYHGVDGLWRVDISTGQRTQLFGNNDGCRLVAAAALSWDGTRIVFTSGGKAYLIDNDGNNLKRIDKMRIPGMYGNGAVPGYVQNITTISWGQSGILFGFNYGNSTSPLQPSVLFRYDPDNDKLDTLVESEWDNGWGAIAGTYGSATGEVVWSRINRGTCENNEQTGRTYHHLSRFGVPLKVFAWRDHGHGEALSLCGRYMYHVAFSHDGFWVHQTSDGAQIKSLTMPLEYRQNGTNIYITACANNPDYFGMEAYNLPGGKCAYIAYNHVTHEVHGTIPNPVDGAATLVSMSGGYVPNIPKLCALWLGESVPSPNETRANIVPLDNEAAFDIAGETGPVSKAVEIWNLGGGEMQLIATQVPSSASWLSTGVNGSCGNTQYLLLEVDPARITGDSAWTTVTVSAGNARNTAQITVTASKKRLAAPLHFKASQVKGAESQVKFSWVNNSNAAAGYVIECCREIDRPHLCHPNEGGSYGVEIERLGANATSHIESGLTRDDHKANNYRIRALATGAYSASLPSVGSKFFTSNSANWTGKTEVPVNYTTNDGWITMVQPRRGFVYAAGEDMTISWISDDVARIALEYSSDEGATWNIIAQSISSASELHQSYAWNVPSSLDGKDIILRAVDADDADLRSNVAAVTSTRLGFVKDIRIGASDIVVKNNTHKDGLRNHQPHVNMHAGILRVHHQETAGMVRVYAGNGRLIAQRATSHDGDTELRLSGLSRGIYAVRLEIDGQSMLTKQFFKQ